MSFISTVPQPASVTSTSYNHRPARPEPFDRVMARVLARQADFALQQGYWRQAEHLARRAEDLRGAAS